MAKCAVGMLLLLVSELIISYALQLGFLSLVAPGNAGAAIPMLVGGVAVVPLVSVLFGLFNRTKEWFEKTEALGMICLGSLIYALLIFFALPHFPVPYGLIPAGEMALGYGQFVIQIVDCAGAAVALVVSGFWLLYIRDRE